MADRTLLSAADDSDDGFADRGVDNNGEVRIHVPVQKGLTCGLILSIVGCVTGCSFQFGWNIGVVNQPEDGVTCTLSLTIAASTLGSSFQFGWNMGVVNLPQKVIQSFINETNIRRTGSPMDSNVLTIVWAVIVSIYCIGGMIGGYSGGHLINKFGRKGTMLWNNILVVVGGLLLLLSKYCHSYEMLIAGRFIMGLNCGVSTTVTPVYLSEISPKHIRGATGTINQFTIVLGVLVSQALGLRHILGTKDLWHVLLGLTLVPAVGQVALLPFCPESPVHLLHGRKQQGAAEKALTQLRGHPHIHHEIEEMKQEAAGSTGKKASTLDLFRTPHLREPLIIVLVMQMSQQLSGINAVIYYSTSIFEGAGLSSDNANYATIGTAGVNVAMTFVSVILMDRAGRRTLHLSGLSGMFLSAGVLTVAFVFQKSWSPLVYFGIAAVMLYIVFFAIGPGSIPWFFVAELFKTEHRSAATGLSVLTNWFANFLVGIGYPPLQKLLKSYSFVPFIVLLFIFVIFTYKKVPETKNKSIEEITSQFRCGDSDSHVQEHMREPFYGDS